MRKYSILYVDDEESNLRVFNGLYRRRYNVVTSTSAKEALTIVDQQGFDLIISDQKMPGLSGLEFLAIIKEKNPLIPTILLTGYTDHDVLKEAFNKIGVHKYINKPFDPDSLSTIMDLAIEGYLLSKEKNQIREELTKSESEFRGIFNSMADVFIRVDFEGIIKVVSPSIEELSGYTAEELLGKSVTILYANPEVRLGIVNRLKKLRLIRGVEFSILTKNGEKKYVSSTAKLYYDEDNNALGSEGIFRDITKKKEMQRLLKEQHDLFDETQRMANVGSWRYDVASNETVWSETLRAIYGIDKFNLIDNSLEGYLSFFHHTDQSRAKAIVVNALKSLEDFSLEATIIREDGKERGLSIFGKVVSNEENQLLSVTIACLDNTEAKIRENELIKSEEKFRVLAEELPLRILKIDRKLKVIYANNLAKSGLPSLSTEKGTIHSFFDKDVLPVIIDSIQNLIDSGKGKGSYLEFESRAKWFALNISLTKESIGLDNMLLLIHDITQRKESERLLKNMNEELEGKVKDRTNELEEAKNNIEQAYEKEKELGELKSQFVSTASHQFRTPLTVIQSNIGLLEMQVQQTDPEFKTKFYRVYERIESEIKRMTDLMDNVLILGKKESGIVKPNLQLSDVLALVQVIVKKHNEIQEDDRKVEVTYEGLPSMYQLDPELFENAFSNLMSNAFKYSKSKPAPLVHLQYNKGILIITVQDFGVGIPEEDVSHIFEPFYRGTNVKDIKGTGLGTSIIKAYLELMDIAIDIKSELGEGSVFTIKIEK